MTHTVAAFAALVCLTATAHAQEGRPATGGANDTPKGPFDGLTVGPGIAVNAQPYRETDGARVFPIPLLSYRQGRFDFFGTTLTADIAEVGPARIGALAAWRFQSYDEGDSPVLAGMADRSSTLDAGLLVTAAMGKADIAMSARADVLGNHNGFEIDAVASYELADGRAASLRPGIGLRYHSSSLTDYYFGVEADEAAILPGLGGDPAPFERFAYETGDAFVPFARATGRYAVSRQVSVFGLANLGLLPDAITDSPIVGRDIQVFTLLGVTYTFGAR